MKPAYVAAISVLMAVACGSDKEFVQTPYTGPTDPTKTTTASVLSVTFQGPAPTIGPGETAQMRAVAQLSDGSTRDVTAEATWTSSQVQIATVSGGLLTGQALGRVQIRVAFQSRSVAITLVIKPAGTFVLSGSVTEAGPVPIGSATVSVVSGLPYQVTASSTGFYELFGVSGMVTLRVSKEGYIDATQTVIVAQDQRFDVQLKPISAPVAVAGSYRMTMTIAASCDAVPDDQKMRVYTAAITQDNALVRVELSDANFAQGGNTKFNGKVSGGTVTFDLGTTDFYYTFYRGLYVLETVAGGQTLGFAGTMTTTAAAQSLSGVLSGAITFREGNRTRSCPSTTNSSVGFARK